MEARADAIAKGELRELVWLVEHPPLYTAGTSAQDADLVEPDRFPVHRSGRGGQYTYHGPGQRVAYVMLDLSRRQQDRAPLRGGPRSVAHRDARRIQRPGRAARRPGRGLGASARARAEGAEDKIAAIGIRVRRWVSFHGISLNVEPDLDHFSGIVPCGVRQHGVTSLVDLGIPVTMPEVDAVLRQTFEAIFGPTERRVRPQQSYPEVTSGDFSTSRFRSRRLMASRQQRFML